MPLIVIGPTASGKTGYALEHALKNGAYIINADALQVYHDLPTLTARPQEQYDIPHFLFGFLKPQENLNVMLWYQKVSDIVKAHGENYIMVGGTMFYVKTWLEGGLSSIPEVPLEIQSNVRQLSKEELLQQILVHDPEMLSVLHTNDTQRLGRALEVKLATGKSIKTFHTASHEKSNIPVHVMDVTKEKLHQQIRERTVQMMQNGAIDEVQALLLQYADLMVMPIKKVIGVAEVVEYLQNRLSKDEMIEKIILLTIQYAKRQVTFCKQIVANLQ